ncbi:MAG: MFS transporter [Alphaproteobacteria bacterium]|nr:MFS transporter [Alphaproteobacteria bacterium]
MKTSTLTDIPDTNLSPDVKKSVAIVLVGNFLDYFDLMLAVHMTVILTKIFIPGDSALTPILVAFTFCSSFVIRPFAAIFWGYIGDTIGRVPVLISTTFLMSISCVLIPNIPSYAEWGTLSAVLFLTLRLVQGFASGGEAIAADVFIAETVPKPKVYLCSSLVAATCSCGGLVACGIGAICILMSPENGWKIPFYIGSGVAVIGTIARKTLKETPEFVKTLEKKKTKRKFLDLYLSLNFRSRNIPALFALHLFPAVAFYFSLAYLPSVLINQLGISPSRVMGQSTLVLFFVMCSEVGYGLLGLKFHPFSILKFKMFSLLMVIPVLAIYIDGLTSPLLIFIIQVSVACLGQELSPAYPIITKGFPVIGRYTSLLLIWAISHSLIYLMTACIFSQVTGFQGLCLLLFVAASISLIGLYAFVPEDKMLTLKLANNSSEDFSLEEILAEEKKYEKLDQKEKEQFLKKWLNKIK